MLSKDFKYALASQNAKNLAKEKTDTIISKNDFDPLFTLSKMHEDEISNIKHHNSNLSDIVHDLTFINTQVGEIAYKIREEVLLNKKELSKLKNILLIEREKLNDVNVLCNAFTDFDKVIPLSEESFSGDVYARHDVISAKADVEKQISYKIDSISGNGIEGNKFVYEDNRFLQDIINRSQHKFIYDDSPITKYEYSRITTSHEEPIMFEGANIDSIDARCTLSLSAEEEITHLKIMSDTSDTIIESLQISDNGIDYLEQIKEPIEFNDVMKIYENPNYISGTGIISFPASNYVKLILRSNGYTDETIAFKENNNILISKYAKRHVIAINDIKAEYKEFQPETIIKSKQLITKPINSIALFSSEYIPQETFNKDNVKYILTINGVDHEIVPINGIKNGKKIIKFAEVQQRQDYAIYLNETIKSAYLTIKMISHDGLDTPFISNIKVLLGGI